MRHEWKGALGEPPDAGVPAAAGRPGFLCGRCGARGSLNGGRMMLTDGGALVTGADGRIAECPEECAETAALLVHLS